MKNKSFSLSLLSLRPSYFHSSASNKSQYIALKHQNDNPFDTKYYLHQKNKNSNLISFWNDIPINLNKDIVNCCVQIPKQQSAKLQVIKQVLYHPLMQDTRKNIFTKEKQLRYYAKFPLFNYGFIPQTWQQNLWPSQDAGLYGDDDPIDICEIGSKERQIGDIFRAKILGSFCLIDQGQIDWKIILLNEQQAVLNKISSIDDVSQRHIQSIMKWFKQIKTYDGKQANRIAYDEKIFGKVQTIKVIQQVHAEWKKLMTSSEQGYDRKRKEFHIQKKKIQQLIIV